MANSKIFISYRRDDSAGFAGRIYDRLKSAFPEAQVFMDVDTIAPGDDFIVSIENAVGNCDVFVALIGTQWVSITDSQGNRRLDDPHDFVRLEVATALKRGIRVIPVLLQDAPMPRADELPDDLDALTRRNGLSLEHANFNDGIEHLIAAIKLDTHPADEPKPAPAKTAASASNKMPIYIGGGIGVIAIVGLILWAALSAIGGGSGKDATSTPTLTRVIAQNTNEPTKTPTHTPTPTLEITITPTPSETPTLTPTLAKKIFDDKNIPMVLVPAGTFEMGGDANQASELCQDNWGSSTQSQCDIKWFQDEEPQHTVYLDDFYMDQYEITNAQYAEFLNEAGNQSSAGVTWMNAPDKQVKIHQYGSQWRVDSGFANYPVIEVTWYGAQAYCAWRGGRLPTEAEWEKAARGGLEGNLYPWGDQTPSCDLANLNGCSDFPFEVGEFSPNGYKIYDMAGNLWEWVSDWYGIDAYTFSSDSNPTGPSTGTAKAIRGGGWGDWPYRLRVSQRLDFEPGKSDNSTGFRCARPIESEVAAAPQPQPTQDPFQSNGSCSSASPPCSYTVQDGDTFSKIAVSVYGDHIYTPVLMNFNRNPSGVRISLHPGDPIFVPSLENLPELNYPDCGSNVFPCQYTVNDGDTYKSIASEFYGNSSAAQLIENNNWDYDRNEDKLITLQLRSGVDIILPAP